MTEETEEPAESPGNVPGTPLQKVEFDRTFMRNANLEIVSTRASEAAVTYHSKPGADTFRAYVALIERMLTLIPRQLFRNGEFEILNTALTKYVSSKSHDVETYQKVRRIEIQLNETQQNLGMLFRVYKNRSEIEDVKRALGVKDKKKEVKIL